jgi:serine/threonine protein kinase
MPIVALSSTSSIASKTKTKRRVKAKAKRRASPKAKRKASPKAKRRASPQAKLVPPRPKPVGTSTGSESELTPVQPLRRLTPTGGAEEAETFWDRFEIQGDPLGTGAFGAVYKVRDAHTGKLFAVKVLREESGDLDDEVEALKMLSNADGRGCHPGIVCYYGVYRVPTEQGIRPALLMQYIPGINLDEYSKRSNKPRAEVKKLFKNALKALEYTHSEGMAHRDLKPGNMMHNDGNTVLIDFGLACQFKQCRGFSGTAAYAAPERIARRVTGFGTIDYEKSDAFELGASFYQIITGNKPRWLPSARGQLVDKQRLQAAIDSLDARDPTEATVRALLDPNPSKRLPIKEALALLQ